MNLQALMKQAQSIQKDMMKAKNEIDEMVFYGESSLVKVEINGKKEDKEMKKIIKLEGLCCANCAAKIEDGVKKVPGVKEASLSFMTQRLTIVAEDGMEAAVVEAARKIADKIEPEAEFKVLR